MNKNFFRGLALVFVLGLFVSLVSSLGARDPRPQERTHPPRPAYPPNSKLPPPWKVPGSQDSTWVRTYQYFFSLPGPDRYEDDGCVSILPGGDGGIVVAATISYQPPYPASARADIVIVGLDPSGNVEWKTFYESDPNIQCYNEAKAMIRTRSGDYLLVGDSGKDDVSATDALVMKLGDVPQVPHLKNGPYHHYSYTPLSGPVKWIKTYAITSPNQGSFVRANTVAETQDGGYLVAGRGGVAGVWIMKLDSDGNILWHKDLSNGRWIDSCSLQATPDGGFILTGISDTKGNVEVFKLDGNAVVQWHKSFVSGQQVPGGCSSFGGGVAVLRDGGYILTGASDFVCAGEHSCFLGGWVCRLDPSGEIIWQRGYTDSIPADAFETADGGIFMLDSRQGGIMKLKASGDLEWFRYLGDEEDSGLGLAPGFQNDDEGFVIGYSSSDNYHPYFNTHIGIMRLGPTGMLETACPLVAEGTAAEMDPRIRVTPGTDLVSSDNSVRVRTVAYAPFDRTCEVRVACGSQGNR